MKPSKQKPESKVTVWHSRPHSDVFVRDDDRNPPGTGYRGISVPGETPYGQVVKHGSFSTEDDDGGEEGVR